MAAEAWVGGRCIQAKRRGEREGCPLAINQGGLGGLAAPPGSRIRGSLQCAADNFYLLYSERAVARMPSERCGAPARCSASRAVDLHLFVVGHNGSAHSFAQGSVAKGRFKPDCCHIIPHIIEGRTDAFGRCAAEVPAYLTLMVEFYDQLRDDDIALFAHAHETSHHTTTSLDVQLALLAQHRYLLEEEFGGVYCSWRFAPLLRILGGASLEERFSTRSIWNDVFHETVWQDGEPSSERLSFPCCGTFFTRWRHVRRHPLDQYLRLKANTAKACADPRSRLRAAGVRKPHEAGRLFEGAWHTMLVNQSIRRPPYCTGAHRNGSVGTTASIGTVTY